MNVENSSTATEAKNLHLTVEEWIEVLTDWVDEQDRSGDEVAHRPGRHVAEGLHAWAWLVGEGHVVHEAVRGPDGHPVHVWVLT